MKGVESKVIVVPWVSSCMGFVPEGSSICLPEGTNPILHSAGDLCHSAFIDPLIVSQEAIALYTVPFKYQQLWCKCLL